jgi:hypothetical protein
MNDHFELQLRRAFRHAELPLAPDRLRQVLIDLPVTQPRRQVSERRLLHDGLRLAATLAVLAVVSAAVLYGIANLRTQVGPDQSPSPSPTTQVSPTPTGTESTPAGPLPAPAAMLLAHPDVDIAFQRSAGPADRPVSDDAALESIDLGPLEFARDVVLAAACLGPGELSVDVRYPNVPGASDPFVGLVTPCDGQVTEVGYQGSEPGNLIEFEVIGVRVPLGASWRFVIGEVQPRVSVPGTFAPIGGTDGWWRLWDAQLDAVDPSTGLGVGVRVADDVTRLAIWVECAGADSAELVVVHDTPSPTADLGLPIGCTPGEPERHELIVAAGEEVSIKVTTESVIAARLYVEANAMPVSDWGEPASLSSEIADAPFVASNLSHVAIGRLGATRQTLVDLGGVGPGNRPGDDHVALPANTIVGASLDLYSITSGERLLTLADHDAGTLLRTTWVDTLNGQVFYTLSTSSLQLELYRVALDGSGQTHLGAFPADSSPTLALDEASFVTVSCQARSCQTTVIDTVTLASRSFEYALDLETCGSAGASDGVVVLRMAASCATTPAETIVVLDYEGNELMRAPDPGSVNLVRTNGGPVVLVRGFSADSWQVIDTSDGSSEPLVVDAPAFAPVSGIDLPPDWVLLAPFSGIGDLPIHPSLLLGEPPLLVNVVTGETIEMLNLPH